MRFIGKKIKKKLEKIKSLCIDNYVFSKQLGELLDMPEKDIKDTIGKYKYIFVGDNPGENEKQQQEYFVGDSGTNLNNFISDYLELEAENYLLLNKTLYSTKATKEIDKEKGDITQKEIVDLLYFLLNANKNVFIVLMGVEFFSEHKKAKFYEFYNSLFNNNDYEEHKERIGLYYHPSRRQLLTIEEQEEIDEEEIDKIAFFKAYGRNFLNDRRKKDIFKDTIKKFKKNQIN